MGKERPPQEIRDLQLVEQVLEKAKGKLTLAEVTAETGMPLDNALNSLNILLERYSSKVEMNYETGDLLFNFAYPLLRRDAVSFKERMIQVWDVTKKVLKYIYKASIGIVLIAYFVFFVLLLLAAASQSKDNKNNNNSGIGKLISAFIRALIDVFFIKNTMKNTPKYTYKRDGEYMYKATYEEPNKGKGFLQSVFSFVFGPERVKRTAEQDAMEVISFLRMNDGKLSVSDIIALSGVTLDEAESRMAEYVGKYKGELYISPDAVLTAEFPQVMHQSNSELKGEAIQYYKNEIDPPAEFTGNTSGKNFAIILMNSFNLVMSSFLLSIMSLEYDGIGIYFWVGLFPLAVSALYFIIPILRIPSFLREKRTRRDNILRKSALSAVILKKGKQVYTQDIVINCSDNHQYSREERDKMMERISREYRGEVKIDPAGGAYYDFERIQRDMG